ncbi:MAG: Imidazolonepropionase [Phycisphaerales bacterium]|nr:Imidazolonepropionase [Phycisphaerales bacterium]
MMNPGRGSAGFVHRAAGAAAWALVCAVALAGAGRASAQVAIKAGVIHTMEGPAIRDGVIVITDGKIAAIGPAGSTAIPQGHEVLQAAVAVPGLVDPRGTVGLTGLYNSAHDSDQLENSSAVQPALRAIDAYNPQERLVQWVREFGVTTVNTGHAPGNLISGQTIVVKTAGNTIGDVLVKSPAMVSATLGSEANEAGGKSPGTRAKQIAMLRDEFIKAREYLDKLRKSAERAPAEGGADADGESAKAAAPADRNLHLEMLGDVLEGKTPLLIRADRAQDIESALRLTEECGLKVVLESASAAFVLVDRIKAAGVDVIVHPSMQRAVGSSENQSFETAAALVGAGVRVAIESGYESYVPKTRVVLFEAAIAAANGLTFDQALATITIDAARILGVDDRVGSLAAGKDGDVALYDGDPFEYTTHCTGVVIEGRLVSRAVR